MIYLRVFGGVLSFRKSCINVSVGVYVWRFVNQFPGASAREGKRAKRQSKKKTTLKESEIKIKQAISAPQQITRSPKKNAT